jgi:hypothetical protein
MLGALPGSLALKTLKIAEIRKPRAGGGKYIVYSLLVAAGEAGRAYG